MCIVRWLLVDACRPPRSGVRILVYHTIASIPARHDPGRLSVPPRRFAQQLVWLKRWGYTVVSIDEALDMVRGLRPIRAKLVVMTFDDGFRDLWTQVYPRLQQAGVPAALFVVPGHLDQECPFPWLDLPERFERPLSWAELRQLGQDPEIVVGSHTWSHRRLSSLSVSEQEHELVRSKQVLESVLGRPVTWFAYPYGNQGSFSTDTVACVQRAGFIAACANIMGLNQRGDSPWELKRTRVGWEDGRVRFWLKLAGAYDWSDQWRAHRKSEKTRTAERFGDLWSRSDPAIQTHDPLRYHTPRLVQVLALPPPDGVVLDAGCGEGIDVVAQAQRPGVKVVGVELSEAGCRISAARCAHLHNASIVRADLCRLPFGEAQFDFIASYGVLHHLPEPMAGLRELVRVLKPGAWIAVYLYQDFHGRPVMLRWLVALVSGLRRITTRLSPRVLYGLCWLASPGVYLVFTVPSRLLRIISWMRPVAEQIPFRHGRGPFRLAGDLYDRFSAPIERRYSRDAVAEFLGQAGLDHLKIVQDRGWMASGMKPLAAAQVSRAAGAFGTPIERLRAVSTSEKG